MHFSFGTQELVASETYDSAAAVDVDIVSYAVEVQTHKDSTIKVEVYRGGLVTSAAPTISYSADTVRVKQSATANFLSIGGGKVILYVPEQSVMDYTLKTVSGSVQLYAASNTATLKTVSGSIKTYGGGDTVQANTVSGSIKLFAPFRLVDCESTSGSVRARADDVTERVSLSSVSGSAKLSLDNVSGYRMTHSSVSGSVKDLYHGLDFAKSGNGSWGDESLEIRMKTTSGSIKLTDWED